MPHVRMSTGLIASHGAVRKSPTFAMCGYRCARIMLGPGAISDTHATFASTTIWTPRARPEYPAHISPIVSIGESYARAEIAQFWKYGLRPRKRLFRFQVFSWNLYNPEPYQEPENRADRREKHAVQVTAVPCQPHTVTTVTAVRALTQFRQHQRPPSHRRPIPAAVRR
jgi:hypothetical protein